MLLILSYFMPLIFVLFFSPLIFAKSNLPYPIKMDNAKAIYTIDGDSISLTMRIKGIDTPEKAQKCRNKGEVLSCGIIARDYLRVLLDNTQGELYINPIAIGYYGRVLVDVYKGGVDIAQMMVKDGMAFAYGNKYRQEEELAKKNKQGFWGYEKPPLIPRIWRKRYMRR